MKQLVLANGPVDGTVRIDGPDAHYLLRVRRLGPGDRFVALFDSQRWFLEVTACTSTDLSATVLGHESASSGALELTLFPFLLKAGKLDDVIRQACEAGVRSLVPVLGDHSVSRWDSAEDALKKLDRWKSIARQAAQQSGNAVVCEVHPPLLSRDLAAWWGRRGPLLVFHQLPLAKGSLHRYLADNPTAVGLIVGPEGGLSDSEVESLRAAGGQPVWLGPAVLRAETANAHAVAAVHSILQERSEWTLTPESRA